MGRSLKFQKKGYIYLYPDEEKSIKLIIEALSLAKNNTLTQKDLELVCKRLALEKGYEEPQRTTIRKNLYMLIAAKPAIIRIWQHKRLRLVKLLAIKEII